MKSFYLEIPTRMYFGRNTALDSLRKEKSILGSCVMILTTSRSLLKSGAVGELVSCIEEILGKDKVIVIDYISPEPQLSEIREAIQIGKAREVTAVIGFGGGSSIDAAKGTALGIGTSYSIDEYYYEGKKPDKIPIPVIAIPTTAGTGSELSGSAVISDSATGMKKGIRGSYMYPTVAIVDSKYTDSMPFKVTRDSGFDAFAHALETYVSVKATPLSDILSEQAIKMIAEALPELRKNLNNENARDTMSYASMLMGINIGNVGTLLPHRLQYPVGIKTHTSHGEGLLAVFPAWVEEVFEQRPQKICKISSILSGRKCSTKDECMDAVYSFMRSIDGLVKLSDLGITDQDIEEFIPKITGVLENDPAYTGSDVIERIYKNSMQSKQ